MIIKAGITKSFNLIWIVFAVFLLLGCQKSDDEGERRGSATEEQRPVQAQATARDSAPTTRVHVSEQMPGKPRRIVSLAPNITEILFALGAGDRVVAVTRFCDYPPEVESLPEIGGIVDPDLESIVSYEPDLVIGVTSGADTSIRDQLDRAEISYAFAEMDDIEETYAGIQRVGTWVGEDRRAHEVVEDMQSRIEALSVEPGDQERPGVLFVYGRNPLTVAGPGTFGHDLVERAGGSNPLADADTKYPKVDLEKILELDPDRIIDATMGEAVAQDYWTQYEGLSAVEHGHIYRLEDAAVLRPGPRLVEALAYIRTAVRGEPQSGADSP